VRINGFLSKVFAHGNTDIERGAIFFRVRRPLLTFGRECAGAGADRSAMRMTAFTIKDTGDPNSSSAPAAQR
jgi:hypothetical protein